MARKANPGPAIRCMHQYKARLRRRGLLSSVESQKIVAELENDMEDIVCEVMQPQVVNYPPLHIVLQKQSI